MKQGLRKPDGGFCLITAIGLMHAWWAYRRSIIRLYDLRVWLACWELTARRCNVQKGIPARYTEKEIHTLVGGAGGAHIAGAIHRLETANLIHWSSSALQIMGQGRGAARFCDVEWAFIPVSLPNERRLIPVPRRLIRLLARTGTRALIATAFGHLIRCLFYKRGECFAEGTCKASWIAEAFGIDERRVKAARKEWVGLGWLVAKTVPQWTWNRHGAVMRVNMFWRKGSKVTQNELPPPEGKIVGDLPPPNKNKKLSTRSKKPETRVGRPPGVQEPEKSKPEFRDVKLPDLGSAPRLNELFRQAVRGGLVNDCESDRLKFFSAAERAISVGNQNPCGLFVALVRRQLWAHIRQIDEDAARARLKRWTLDVASRCKNSVSAPLETGWSFNTPPMISAAERMTRADIRVLIRHSFGERELPQESCVG